MKIISTILASIALVLSGLVAAPALAVDVVYVDSFVVPDPSLGDDCMGNGITLVGDAGVTWTVNGEPYAFTPQSRTLWLPQGFDGTITATAAPGFELFEIDAERGGTSLSWHHVVEPQPCGTPTSCTDNSAQLTEQAVELSVLQAKIDRQRARINRLRAKLQRH